jgi:Microcystin-dependent protein
MASPFLGQIISVGFNFAPVGWYSCDGQLLPIDENQALFQLLGTTYGGNGTSTFALPNLNGRVPLGVGQGQGLSSYVPGQIEGTESVTLLGANTPPHNHTISFSANAGTSVTPKVAGKTLVVGANAASEVPGFYADGPATLSLRKDAVTPNVGGQPHENRQQFLVLNYIIAYAGIYPSQN